MFRAEIRWLANGPTLKLEGRLVSDWAEQARLLVTKEVVPQGLIVDLSELSYVDCMGEQLLKWLASVGAEFVAGNVYAECLCERLHLPPRENMRARFRQRHGRTCEESTAAQSHAS
jgi:hypothetical protein